MSLYESQMSPFYIKYSYPQATNVDIKAFFVKKDALRYNESIATKRPNNNCLSISFSL